MTLMSDWSQPRTCLHRVSLRFLVEREGVCTPLLPGALLCAYLIQACAPSPTAVVLGAREGESPGLSSRGRGRAVGRRGSEMRRPGTLLAKEGVLPSRDPLPYILQL